MSGQPYWTTDIGGFISFGFFEPELYIRWFQWGTFCPIFRTHGTRPDNEPWSFGPMTEEILRKYIRLRYELMPYIYGLAKETSNKGLSMMRAMLIEYPNDAEAAKRQYQFMFGPSILVAPVTEKGAREKNVYLPEDIWYGFWDEKIYKGPVEIMEFTPLDKIPLFIREGSIIPQASIINSAGESQNRDMILHIYPGKNSTYTLYEDDGETYDYEMGFFTETKIEYNDRTRFLRINKALSNFTGFPATRNYKIVYHNINCPEKIMVNNDLLGDRNKKYDIVEKKLEIFLKNQSTDTDINIKLQRFMKTGNKAGTKEFFSVNYDLEYIDEPFGYLLRVYLSNCKNNSGLRGSFFIDMPHGWMNASEKHGRFTLKPYSIETMVFRLHPEARSFSVNSTAILTVLTGKRKENKRIQLGSGWATWWNLAGPYKVNKFKDFDKIYLPEKLLKIDKNNIEPGISINPIIDFNWFGYVNIDKSLVEKNLEIQAIENPVYRIAYCDCFIESPEEKQCLMQLRGENRFKVWLNKKLIAIVDDCVAKPVEYHTDLKKGLNHVLIKASFDASKEWNDRAWGFYFRFVNEKRQPLDDIFYSIETTVCTGNLPQS
ncbi:MAG: DUF5110 domain-containing protein [Actinobacteria bacterium]|nr:DUF5110 domain-containing protein [Actinomycetota bacterium]